MGSAEDYSTWQAGNTYTDNITAEIAKGAEFKKLKSVYYCPFRKSEILYEIVDVQILFDFLN